MKKSGFTVATALLTLVMGTGLLHAQGLYFETVRSGQDVPSTKVSYMPGMAKVVTRSGHVIVLRLDKQVVDILNPGRKTYSEITFDDLENKRFANLTPDQRKVIEEHMAREKNKDSKKASFDVDKTDSTRTIEGFKCTKYVLKRDGKPSGAVWATDDIKAADDFHKDARKLFDRLESAVGGNDRFAEWVDKVDGFPIQIEGHNNTTRITHIKQESIPESQFAVPAEYSKASEAQQGGSGSPNKGK